MSRFVLRTAPAESADPDPEAQFVDVFEGGGATSTVHVAQNLVGTREPPQAARDLLWLAIGAYAADRVALRKTAADGWSRNIALAVPAASGTWAHSAADMARMLGFVSGDRWSIEARDVAPRLIRTPAFEANVVCLFSGGLDSLTGAINLLAEDLHRRVLLVGVQDQPISAGRQRVLFSTLAERYPGRVELLRIQVDVLRPDARQERSLPETREDTSRARSLLFLGFGLACASALGPGVPVYMPENGFIGINVPLIAARSGSASTRTTHPFFVSLLSKLLADLGVTNEIRNPLRHHTKGEALQECRDQTTLAAVASSSVSCAHPTVARWKRQTKSCGYCYPCLIRRAAMHTVGLDQGAEYLIDVLTTPDFLASRSIRPASLRALCAAVRRGAEPIDVLRNGPVPEGAVEAFVGVYQRGVAELESWLRTAIAPDLLARLP